RLDRRSKRPNVNKAEKIAYRSAEFPRPLATPVSRPLRVSLRPPGCYSDRMPAPAITSPESMPGASLAAGVPATVPVPPPAATTTPAAEPPHEHSRPPLQDLL